MNAPRPACSRLGVVAAANGNLGTRARSIHPPGGSARPVSQPSPASAASQNPLPSPLSISSLGLAPFPFPFPSSFPLFLFSPFPHSPLSLPPPPSFLTSGLVVSLLFDKGGALTPSTLPAHARQRLLGRLCSPAGILVDRSSGLVSCTIPPPSSSLMATASSFQQRGRGGGPRGRGGAPPSRWGGGPPHGVTSPRGSPAPPRPGQALAPAAASAAGTANAFPSLGSTEADEAHRKMRDRMLFLLVSLVVSRMKAVQPW